MQISRRRLLAGLAACGVLSAVPCSLRAQPLPPLLFPFGKLPASGQIRHVLSAGPVADLLLMALAPEKLLGFARLDLRSAPDFVATPAIRALPVLGRLTGSGNTLSTEKLLLLNPDLIIDTGNVTETYRSLAQRISSQTGISWLLVDGRLQDAPRQLLETGKVLGVQTRAEPLAALASRFISQAQAFASRLQKPIRFYSARGTSGLETGLQGSLHTETAELLGLQNVAHAAGRHGLTSVSIEQLLLWQPDLIITQSETAWQSILHDPLWQEIRAVQQGNVMLFRGFPFGWLDSPPGINRLLGLRRLHARFDSQVAASLADDGREFFRLFLHHEISHSQWQQLLTEPAS